MSNPYDNLDFVSTKDLITLVTESVKSKFWDNLHPISRLHVIRIEGIFTPGTKGYGIGNRSFYGKLDENVTLLYQLSDCEKLAPYEGKRICLAGVVDLHGRPAQGGVQMSLQLRLLHIFGSVERHEDKALKAAALTAKANLSVRRHIRKARTPDEILNTAFFTAINADSPDSFEPCRIGVIQPQSQIFSDVTSAILRSNPELTHAQLDNIISFEQQYVRISEPGEVATALRNLGQRTDVFQMLFIVRGGSEAIASTFEHPSVLDALAECTLPVVSALGHESSHTEFDHYADKSFTTPTDLGAWIGERLRSQKALYAGYVAKLRKMQSLEREKIQALADLNEIKGKFCSEEKQKKELDAKKNELEKKAAFLAIEKSTAERELKKLRMDKILQAAELQEQIKKLKEENNDLVIQIKKSGYDNNLIEQLTTDKQRLLEQIETQKQELASITTTMEQLSNNAHRWTKSIVPLIVGLIVGSLIALAV